MAVFGLRRRFLLLIKYRRVHFYRGVVLSNRCGCLHKSCNGIPVQALVLQLGSKTEEKMNSQCEFIFLRSLTPARMIRIKQIMNDAA